MTINVENDGVEVYLDSQKMWRWRRVDTNNGRIVAISGEGYSALSYAREAAQAYNPGVIVVVAEEGD